MSQFPALAMTNDEVILILQLIWIDVYAFIWWPIFTFAGSITSSWPLFLEWYGHKRWGKTCIIYLRIFVMCISWTFECHFLCIHDPPNLHDHYSLNDENTKDEVRLTFPIYVYFLYLFFQLACHFYVCRIHLTSPSITLGWILGLYYSLVRKEQQPTNYPCYNSNWETRQGQKSQEGGGVASRT